MTLSVPLDRGRHIVVADLDSKWDRALHAAGFDPNLPTVWVAEGVLFYLTHSAVSRMLRQSAQLSANRSVFGADMFGTGVLRLSAMQSYMNSITAHGRPPFCTDEPGRLLDSCGWQVKSTTLLGQDGANFGRVPKPPPSREWLADPSMRTYLVEGERGVEYVPQ